MSTIEITDAIVLAAVDRTIRHEPRHPVPVWAVYEHLGLARRSGAARRVHVQLLELDGAFLKRGRRHRVETWELTASGKQRLSRLRTRGELPDLPEAPQHRKWRQAHELAKQHFEGLWIALRDEIDRADELLALHQTPSPPSDVWFEIGDRVEKGCRRLGSAAYCLFEWREPTDARRDVDDHTDPSDDGYDTDDRAKRRARRMSRRNVLLWAPPPPLVALGQAIRVEREQRQITTDELAHKASLDPRLLATIEAGLTDPPYDQLMAIADALGVPSSKLVARVEALEASQEAH
jgi:ribosome-binding protein aMBF1 (putative translation factor)